MTITYTALECPSCGSVFIKRGVGTNGTIAICEECGFRWREI